VENISVGWFILYSKFGILHFFIIKTGLEVWDNFKLVPNSAYDLLALKAYIAPSINASRFHS